MCFAALHPSQELLSCWGWSVTQAHFFPGKQAFLLMRILPLVPDNLCFVFICSFLIFTFYQFILLVIRHTGGRGGPSRCITYKLQIWYFDG